MYNIIVLLGPSGSGKSTLQKSLDLKPIVTWTSRKPRSNEIHGKHYYFIDKDTLLDMHKRGLLLEFTQYNGNFYGSDYKSIMKSIDSNSHNTIILDANGARVLKNKFPDSVLIIGVFAPYKECEYNLYARDDENANNRLSTYSDEIETVFDLSDIIINNAKINWKKTQDVMKLLKIGIQKYNSITLL